jgi:hypothetical protein
MSINNIGSKNPFYGKTHTPEYRLATSLHMSAARNPQVANQKQTKLNRLFVKFIANLFLFIILTLIYWSKRTSCRFKVFRPEFILSSVPLEKLI